jgi:outer membrane lipoprotein-sorting protein
MKKEKKRHFLVSVFILLTAFMCIGWADTWEDLKTAAGTVASVRAEFTQEKHMKILARPLVSKGVLFFQGPDSLRWEYTHPVQSILLLHKGKTRRFVQKNDSLIEDASANLQSMQVVVQEITQWLNGRFDDNPAFAASLEPGRKIVMVPRDESFARLIQRIEVSLADRPAAIKSVMIFENEDSFTKLDFSDVILNQQLDDALFRDIR